MQRKLPPSPLGRLIACLLLLLGCFALQPLQAQVSCSATICDYTVSGPNGGASFVVGSGANSISLGDNQVSGNIPIGFNFNFYGSCYSNVRISSNGFVYLGSTGSTSSGCCSGLSIPANDAVNNIIAGAWGDLDPTLPATGKGIGAFTTGSAPNRIFHVSFTNIRFKSSIASVTFQIKMYESNGNVEILSRPVSSGSLVRTQGLEDATGSTATPTPGRNASSWSILSNETVTFSPTIDVTSPTITGCPSNISLANAAGQCSRTASWTVPSATDDCALQSFTASAAPGSTFPVGVTAVTYTATDEAGNTTTCSFNVEVNDTENPTLTCPGNITRNNDAGNCSAVVTYPAPSFADNCPGVTLSQSSGSPSGAAFSVGTTTNTFQATDGSGNTASCSFTITVNDNEDPNITCPANISVNNDAGVCNASVSWIVPLPSDNCPGVSISQTSGTAPGSAFPVGTSTISYEATDAAGNSRSCSFDIVVSDAENPVITCPSNISVNNDSASCFATVTYTAPVGTDNCAISGTSLTAGQGSGGTFSVGTTTETYTATDSSGNTASCSFTVTVNDIETPTITCPPNISVPNILGLCSAIVTYPAPSTSDNCPSPTVLQIAGLGSGIAFSAGVTTNTFQVSDAGGNTATCSFTVTVVDTLPPTITCPANITVPGDTTTCTAVVSYSAPTASDNCAIGTITQFNGLPSGAAFPTGVTNNSFLISDPGGNTATCTFTVTVTDSIFPLIICPGDTTVSNTSQLCGASFTYSQPVGLDNCPGFTTQRINGLGSGALFPVGVSTEVYEVSDANGNKDSCSFNVTVIDSELPQITGCPSDTTIPDNGTQCGNLYAWTSPLASDNCPGLTFTGTAAPPTFFNVGASTVLYVATDNSGNRDTCSFVVTVVDQTQPSISCPANISVNNDPGVCGAIVTYTVPGATDNCPGVSDTQSAGLASGATFPIGTTVNTYVAVDANGLTDSCSFTVTVTDNELPVFNCPATATVAADPGLCSAVFNYSVSFTDNCPGSGAPVLTAGLASGSAFPVGTNTVTYTGQDVSGNSATCTFDVVVQDNQAPVLTCPANITVSNAPGSCDSIVSFSVTGTDNCPGSSPVQIAGLGSGSSFPAGVTTNTYVISDASSNADTCTFTVTVSDVEDPVITCPANITASNTSGLCSAQISYAVNSTDNCPGFTETQIAGIFSTGSFPVGVTTNTWTVSDAAGRSDTCSFTVTIVDTSAPQLTCPSNVIISNDSGQCSAIYLYSVNATDNCPTTSPTQLTGIASGGTFPIGVTTNTFVYADPGGNADSCSFTVTVQDNENPVITCPAAIAVNTDTNQCSAVVNYLVTDSDNCPGQLRSLIGGLASGSAFPKGTTSNTLQVTDVAGNTATCTFQVTVTDNQAPLATCPANITVSSSSGSCSRAVSYTATVTDNCPGATLSQTAGLPGGSIFAVGTTTNTFIATDAVGLTATCSFTITVVDSIAPSISCPVNLTVGTSSTSCDAVVTYNAPSGTDNCPGQTTALTSGIGSGGTFPLGTTTETYEVTDAFGNTASCSFTVTVNDNKVPVITCPPNITTSNSAGFCSAFVTFPTATATDNCSTPIVSQTGGPSSGSAMTVGVTSITFMAADTAGNTSSCTFNIIVNDTEAPAITCPVNISVGTDSGSCSAVVSFSSPVGTDNCPGVTTQPTAGLTSGSAFPQGTTTQTFLVTDNVGLTDSCSFTVTVTDDDAPVISACPSDIVLSADSTNCTQSVNWTLPTASDACALVGMTSNFNPGTSFSPGTTQVVYVAADVAGNVDSCSFNVIITPDPFVVSLSSPTFNCGFNIDCNGASSGAATVDVQGGCLPYTITWAGGQSTSTISNLTAGTYPVTVMDGSGNMVLDSITLSEPSPLSLSISAPQNLCPGDVAQVLTTVTGGSTCSPYAYSWSSGSSSASLTGVGAGTYSVTVTDVNGCSISDSVTIGSFAPQQVNLGADTSFCGGGTLTLNAGSGFATYAWSSGGGGQMETVNASGTYSVIATDSNGCSTVDTISVGIYTNPTVSLGPDSTTCLGDSILLDAGAGFASYLWSDGSTGQTLDARSTGQYTVTAFDANGCSGTDTVNLSFQPGIAPNATTIGPAVLCQNDALDLTADSGFVAYLWSNGATTQTTTVTNPGVYTLEATNPNGCVSVDTVVISFINAPDPVPVITPGSPVTLCQGDTVSLDAGGGFFSYQWNTGNSSRFQEVTSPGSFWVLVQNGFGCSAFSDTVDVQLDSCPEPIITNSGDTLYSPISSAYQWYFNGGPINGANGQYYVPVLNGTYSVKVTCNNGCEATSPDYTFIVGIEEEGLQSRLEIWPNPTSGQLFVQVGRPVSGPVTFRLVDMLGKQVKEIHMDGLSGRNELDLRHLSNGMYMLQVETKEGRGTFRILID